MYICRDKLANPFESTGVHIQNVVSHFCNYMWFKVFDIIKTLTLSRLYEHEIHLKYSSGEWLPKPLKAFKMLLILHVSYCQNQQNLLTLIERLSASSKFKILLILIAINCYNKYVYLKIYKFAGRCLTALKRNHFVWRKKHRWMCGSYKQASARSCTSLWRFIRVFHDSVHAHLTAMQRTTASKQHSQKST